MSIHIARDADAAAVQALYQRLIGSADWLPPAARADTDFALASVGEALTVSTSPAGALRGFISVQIADAFVHHLYIAPEFQRQGVARALLASLSPAKAWRLKCVRLNRLALAFYTALGWRETGGGEGGHGAYALLEWRPADRLPP